VLPPLVLAFHMVAMTSGSGSVDRPGSGRKSAGKVSGPGDAARFDAYDELRAGLLGQMPEFFVGDLGGKWDDQCAQLPQGEAGDLMLWTGRQHNCHPIVAPDASAGQRPGQLIRRTIELPAGIGHVAHRQSGPVGVALRLPAQG
jgi:hypothetical protein